MAQPTFVNGISVEGAATATTVAATYNWAQTAGNTLVVGVFWEDSTRTISTIVDTAGNTYTLQLGPTKRTTGNNLTVSLYVSTGIKRRASGTNTLTVTFSASTTVQPCVVVAEYTGTTGATDGTGNGATGSSTAASTTGPTTTNAVDTVISFVGIWKPTTDTLTAGASFTNRVQSTQKLVTIMDRAVTSTGTYAGSATLGSTASWGIQTLAIHSGNPQVTDDISVGAALVIVGRISKQGTSSIASGASLSCTGTVRRIATATLNPRIIFNPSFGSGIIIVAKALAIHNAIASPVAIRAAIVATSNVTHNATGTLSRTVSVVATGNVIHNATCSVSAGANLVNTGRVEFRTSASLAPHSSVVAQSAIASGTSAASLAPHSSLAAVAQMFARGKVGIAAGRPITQQCIFRTGAAIGATAVVTHKAQAGVSARGSLAPNNAQSKFGTVTVAATVGVVASAFRQARGTVSVAAGRTCVASSKVLRNATCSVAPGSTIIGTAKAIHNTQLTIIRVLSVVATASASTTGGANTTISARSAVVVTARNSARATSGVAIGSVIGVVGSVLHRASCTVQARATVVQTSRSLATAVTGQGISILAIPNQVKPSAVSSATIQTSSALSRNAAFVIHRATTQLFVGRIPKPISQIRAGVTLAANGTTKTGTAKVRILGGLSTVPRTQANVVLLGRVFANGGRRIFDTCQIASSAAIVGNSTQAGYRAALSVRAALVVIARLLRGATVGLTPHISIAANNTTRTLGPPVCSLSAKASVGANTVVIRRATVGLAAGSSLVAGGSAIYHNIGCAVAVGVVVSANGTNAHSVSISIINAKIALVARSMTRYAGNAGIRTGLSSVPSGMHMVFGQCVIATRGTVTPLAPNSAQGHVAIASKATVADTAKVFHSSSGIIRGSIGVGAVVQGVHAGAVSIHAALVVLGTAFNATTQISLHITGGAQLTCTAIVRHTTGLNLVAGISMVDVQHIMKRSALNVQAGLSILPRSNTLFSALGILNSHSTMLVGVGHQLVSTSNVAFGPSLLCRSSLKSNATANVAAGSGMRDASSVQHYAALQIVTSLSILLGGSKGVGIQTTVHAGADVEGICIGNFFGGVGAVVADKLQRGTVTQIDPRGTVSQTS